MWTMNQIFELGKQYQARAIKAGLPSLGKVQVHR